MGKGALGNSSKQQMYYSGNDKERHVKTVQTMLAELGYDVGPSGPDGNFGNMTEDAVMAFQKDNKDWDGNQLKVDGLVGPDTSDALNRKMVGIWYDEYVTPVELTIEYKMVTVISEKLNKSLKIDVNDALGIKKIKILVVGDVSPIKQETEWLNIQLLDVTVIPFKPMGVTPYRLEIDDTAFSAIDAETNDKGILSVEIPKSAKTGRLILDKLTYDLIITDIGLPGTLPGAVIRMRNMGYPDLPSLISPESCDSGPLECPADDPIHQSMMQFQFDNDLPTTGELDKETAKKLEEVYGC